MIRLQVIMMVLGTSVILSCSQVDRQKYSDEFLSCDYSTEFDSTYNEVIEKRLIELFINDSHLGKSTVEEWNSGIQIIGQGGWGEFDYYCSLYNDDNSNKIELLYRRKPFGLDTIVDYTYEEKELTKKNYNYLIKGFSKIGFCDFSFDLEPNSILLDGPGYAVLGKSGNETKIVTWQGSMTEKSEDRDQLIVLCKKILREAGYPLPVVKIYRERITHDSFEMIVLLDDMTVTDSLVIEHLEMVENEVLASRILASDTTLFDKNLSITVYLDGKKYYPLREKVYE